MANFNKGSYLSNLRPALNKDALFSDTSADYVIPWDPKPYGCVKIRFRTARNNVDYVFLVCDGEKYLMEKVDVVRGCDIYEYELQLEEQMIHYYFEVECGRMSTKYDVRGPVKNSDDINFHFHIKPGFSTPDWAKGAVMYQIYVDRFYNGDKSNDVLTNEYRYIGENTTHVDDWDKYPATMGVREFYGGDLQGVIDKLDYLEDLGIDVIYFNPLFVSPSNHKYDIQDYDYIDPHIGKIVVDEGELLENGRIENKDASRYICRVTDKRNLEASNDLFAKLVKEAHKRGIKVILDGVFNHCGSFNKWMDRERVYENSDGYEKGAYISQDSPYRDFFKFYNNDWPYNGSYDGWWGHDTLPKLNYEESRKLYDYVMRIARKWVSPPYNVDGWRLDVAADLGFSNEFNHTFWKDFRRNVKEANPNAIIIAEHYGDPSSWLQGDEWDTVMNYDAFMEPVTWFLTGMQKHSDDYRQDMLGNADNFWNAMDWNMNRFTSQSMYIAMNELSNHDHSRFLTRTNHVVGRVADKGPEAANNGVNKAVMREAVMVQMTWVGAPTIYYGDEAGVCGFTDPDNRRSYPWGHEDKDLISYHKEMIRIHKENEELKTGSLRMLYKDYNVIAYGRFSLDNQYVIIINNNDYEKEISFRIGWQICAPKEFLAEILMLTDESGYTVDAGILSSNVGLISVKMKKYSGMVLKIKAPESV